MVTLCIPSILKQPRCSQSSQADAGQSHVSMDNSLGPQGIPVLTHLHAWLWISKTAQILHFADYICLSLNKCGE